MTMERTCKPVAAETINKLTFKDKMRAYKRSPLSLILLLLVCGAALITMLTLLYLIFYILQNCFLSSSRITCSICFSLFFSAGYIKGCAACPVH